MQNIISIIPRILRPKQLKTRFRFGGIFTLEHYRAGELIGLTYAHNLVTNEGLNKILDSVLHNDASATWYVAIVESNTSPSAGLTYATPTYTESTAYDEATRQEYVEAAASSQSTTNSANKATFTINATKTIYGASLVNVSTKGDTAGGGALLCYALFASSRACVDDDVLNITYTVSAADDGA